MPTDTSIPPQYRRVRITTIDDDDLMNKLEELETTTKEEMEAMRQEISALKELIHKLVDDQAVIVSSRATPKKRRLIQISEADDDMMIPQMPVMQNDPIPSQSSLDDNENEEADDEKDQADGDENDNNGGDEVDTNVGQEVAEDDSDQEMEVPQEEYQPPNSYGEELFDESEEINNEKSSSYPGISSSDLPSDFFISPMPEQPEAQQPEAQQPEAPEPPQQEKAQPLQQYHMDPKLTTVNDVWVEWKVGDNCIEKLIERYGDEWRYDDDANNRIFLKRQVIIQEIEYIIKRCNNDDDYATKSRKAIEALEARRQERRWNLNRLSAFIKAFQNSAEQAVGYDGTGEREAYVTI